MLDRREEAERVLKQLRYQALDTLCDIWPFKNLSLLKAWRAKRTAQINRILAAWVDRGPWHYYDGGPPTSSAAEPQTHAGGNE
jgi:hypothetical protein